MSKRDYPAAHSMDTTWFALDRHGHIGVFWSGEAGSVPLEADGQEEGLADLAEKLIGLGRVVDIEFYIDDLAQAPDGRIFAYSWETQEYEEFTDWEPDAEYSAVLWLADESPLASPSRRSSLIPFFRKPRPPPPFTRLPHRTHVLVWAETITGAQVNDLKKRNLVCRAWVMDELPAHRMGVFEYGHGDMFENWVSGPYIREKAPVRPIRTTELPSAERDAFGTFRMPGADFSRDIALQPRDDFECASWDESYVSLSGEAFGEPLE